MAEKFTAGIVCAMVSVAIILALLALDPAGGMGINLWTIAIGASFGIAAGLTLMLAGILDYL